MEQSKRARSILPAVGILFILGVMSLSRFSPHVRSVDAVGLTGSGFAFGVGFALLVLSVRGKIKL